MKQLDLDALFQIKSSPILTKEGLADGEEAPSARQLKRRHGI